LRYLDEPRTSCATFRTLCVRRGCGEDDIAIGGAACGVVRRRNAGSTMALLAVALSFLSFCFPRLRPVLDGEPIVIVRDGQVIEGNLAR
jgi:hypothetical protein